LLTVDQKLFQYFARLQTSPLLELPHVATDPDHECYELVQTAIASLSSVKVAESALTPEDLQHAACYARPTASAELLLSRILAELIATERLRSLSPESSLLDWSKELPSLARDAEGLVPLASFSRGPGVLHIDGHAVTAYPPTPAHNSGYWLLGHLHKCHDLSQVHIRIDPFMHGPAESYFGSIQAMQVWGRPLDWERIESLRGVEHGRWIPDSLGSEVLHTEYVWERRGDEVHFTCEELPAQGAILWRGSRYLHAVFDCHSRRISHLDGALRVFTDISYPQRVGRHLRESGKAGTRYKLFRVDCELAPLDFCAIASAFYVWNTDASVYLASPCSSGEPA
jgi:hypothetical protein